MGLADYGAMVFVSMETTSEWRAYALCVLLPRLDGSVAVWASGSDGMSEVVTHPERMTWSGVPSRPATVKSLL